MKIKETEAAIEAILFCNGRFRRTAPDRQSHRCGREDNRKDHPQYDGPLSGREQRHPDHRAGEFFPNVYKERILSVSDQYCPASSEAGTVRCYAGTLSIIAYKQPVTKAEIEKIRGVKCDHAINKLVEYSLVSELGRLDAPGRPILLGTTEEFLRCFGVQDLESLPVPDPVPDRGL